MNAPVYLFSGPELGERNDAVEALRAAARRQFGQLDEYNYYAEDTRILDVVAQLRNENLFSAGTFIVLRNAELIKKKEDIELISSWAASVTPAGKDAAAGKSAASGTIGGSTILVFVSDEISVEKKLEALVPKDNKRIFWEMFEDRKEVWLENFFRKAGYSVTAEAVESILDMVENNTEALRTECGRFFLCFPAGHQVTADDVEQILAHNREESAFTLFEAMADASESPAKRLENALLILQKIRLSREGSSVALIAGLTYCFRMLYAWHSLHADGARPSDFDLKIKGFSSKKAQTRYRGAASVWGMRQTAAIVSLLARTDMDIRSAGMALEETQLDMMLYEIVIRNGAYCAEYEELPV